jgi:hypothetical protein
VNQVSGVSAAKREVLMNWRSMLYTQLEAAKPAKLPDYQLEYIQKKFRRLHAANDEKEKKAAGYHQQFQAALNANQLQLKQLAFVTFWGYLADTLATRGVKERIRKSPN